MADVYCIVNKTIQLADRTQKTNLNEPLAYDNAKAHAMRVTVVNDNGPEDLSGVSAVGSMLKADGNTVTPIPGTVSGNVAQVVLPSSCYLTPGRFKFTMNLSKATDPEGVDEFVSGSYAKYALVKYNGTVYHFTAAHTGAWTGNDVEADYTVRTALWVEGHVEKNISGTIIDPGNPLGDVSSVISSATAAASAATAAATTAQALITDLQEFEVERDPDVVLAYVQTTESSGGD